MESDLHICEYIRRTVAQEVSCEYSRSSIQATQEAFENALSNLFITATAEVELALKRATNKFIETILTNMAKEEGLDDVFDRSTHY